MPYSILYDEHVPRQVARHLGREDHDVERVVDVPELGEGSADTVIRTYARDTNRLILTSDEGFLRAAPDSDCCNCLPVRPPDSGRSIPK